MFESFEIQPRQLLMLLTLHIISVQLSISIYSGNSTTHEASGGFIVQVRWYQEFQGAGSLIHERFVLTAAHVVYEIKQKGYFIIYGETESQFKEPQVLSGQMAKRMAVIKIEIHQNFQPQHLWNDIAVLLLEKPLHDSIMKSVPLATQPYKANQLARAIGWGQISPDVKHSLVLQEVYVPIIDWDICRNMLLPLEGEGHLGMLCTFSGDRRGACFGDSGGPLTVNGTLIGLIVYVAPLGCGSGKMPDKHIDLYYHRDFIAKAMQRLMA